jgi:translation initiation factor 2B subunit (eIF-2B alpha/beta/delta family)
VAPHGRRRAVPLVPRQLQETFRRISNDRTTGAHGLAVTGLRAIDRALTFWSKRPIPDLRGSMREIAGTLRNTQPAMGVFQRWSLEWSELAAHTPDRLLHGALSRWAEDWHDRLAHETERIARVARRRFPPRVRVLTLSRSASVRAALLAPPPARRAREVVVLESLPGGEGRTFARELKRAGLNARVVSDAEGVRIVRDIELVVLGADAVYADGSVVHKVGTRPLALAAARGGVPVVVVAGGSKSVPRRKPLGRVPALFDRTPPRAIREYWSDSGVVSPDADGGRPSRPGRGYLVLNRRAATMGSLGSPEADRLERLDAGAFRKGKLNRSGTWGVVFLAEWCPFCRAFAPLFAGLASEAQIAVGDLTSLESPLWEEFAVEVVPTVVVFREGEPVYRKDGILGEGLSEHDLPEIRNALGLG